MIHDERNGDHKDSDDDGEGKPGVLSVHPCPKGDDDNGGVRRDSDEHSTHGLHFNFKFHSRLGVDAPVI